MFHDCSEYIYEWIKRQNHVKEESLTDWLLYEISQQYDFIHYQAFSRHEEAQNGSDWEWWILTKDSERRHEFNAYRFLVQAKKLLFYDNDNYPLISYGNKYGTQVDLLLDSANNRNALPLYMFYSIGESDISEQVKNITYITKAALYWCKDCINGCYLSSARVIYDILYKSARMKILDSQLLNNSFKLSILDLLFRNSSDKIDRTLDVFNRRLFSNDIIRDRRYSKSGVRGIKHNENSIPDYLNVFIQSSNDNMNWLEDEMKIKDLSGLGVIDLRQKNNYWSEY